MSPSVVPDPGGGPPSGHVEASGHVEVPGRLDPDPRDPSGDSDGGSGPHEPDVAAALDVLLGQVDAALARLDAGTYGYCGTCGAELDDQLLDRLPTAVLCAACDTRARVSDAS